MEDDYEEVEKSDDAKLWAGKMVLYAFLIACGLYAGVALYSEFGKSDDTIANTEVVSSNKKALDSKYLGNYFGTQESYQMRGDQGVVRIRGNRVVVPSIDFRFWLKPDGIVSMNIKSSENDETYYYDGEYTIIGDEENSITIICQLSSVDKTIPSKPNYYLIFSKSERKALCTKENEPDFILTKMF